jgi:hypothetical protein
MDIHIPFGAIIPQFFLSQHFIFFLLLCEHVQFRTAPVNPRGPRPKSQEVDDIDAIIAGPYLFLLVPAAMPLSPRLFCSNLHFRRHEL